MAVSQPPELDPKILVADQQIRDSLPYALILAVNERQIVRALDGRDALVHALGTPFTLIVADTHLPLIDGFALCELLRSDLATRTCPIILVTSEPRATMEDRAQQVGADALLLKPIEADSFRSEARRLLLRSRELRDQSDRILVKAQQQLSHSQRLVQPRDGRRRRIRQHERSTTTQPPIAPASLRCTACDGPLTYEISHVGGVGVHPEQWDLYSCPSGCGGFEFRPRTRKLRRI